MSKASRKYKTFEELGEAQGKKLAKDEDLQFKPCLVCQKPIGEGYYGSWADGGTCSKTCEAVQEAKPRYPGHSEEEFLMRDESLDADY